MREKDVAAWPARELQDNGHVFNFKPDGVNRTVELEPEFLPQLTYEGLVFHRV